MPRLRLYSIALASLALLAGCGAQPRGLASSAAGDAQTVHTDGLLGGFAGRVAAHDGKLVLELVHQAPFQPSVACGSLAVITTLGRVDTPLFLGNDHQLYGAWASAPDAPKTYTALGAYTGTPTAGSPLRYQLLAGTHLTFEAAHLDALSGQAAPNLTTFTRTPLPAAATADPALLGV